MGKKLEYSEQTKSRLADLYEYVDDVKKTTVATVDSNVLTIIDTTKSTNKDVDEGEKLTFDATKDAIDFKSTPSPFSRAESSTSLMTTPMDDAVAVVNARSDESIIAADEEENVVEASSASTMTIGSSSSSVEKTDTSLVKRKNVEDNDEKDGSSMVVPTSTLLKRLTEQKPMFRVKDDFRVSIEDLQKRVVGNLPFLSEKTLDTDVINLDRLKHSQVKSLYSALDSVPKASDNSDGNMCSIQMIKAINFDKVQYYPSCLIEKSKKLFKPRFRIDVGKVSPNSSICINTGYIVNIPNICKQTKIVGGNRVEVSTKRNKQKPFVIVPWFYLTKNQKGDVFPCVFARDPEDTGLLTFNFTTKSGDVGIIWVCLAAYSVCVTPGKDIFVKSPQQNSAQILKGKDFKNFRYTTNIKHKFDASSVKVEKSQDGRSTVAFFDTFDSTKQPAERYDDQKLAINTRLITFVSSRRREWMNPGLVTISGLISSKLPNPIVPPVVLQNEESRGLNNTHCFTFLEESLHIIDEDFSVVENDKAAAALKPKIAFSNRLTADMKLINGSFYNLERYEDLRKALRKLIKGLRGLQSGVKTAQSIANKHQDLCIRKLLKLYDYHHYLNSNFELLSNIEKTDKQMFDSRLNSSEKPFSVMIYEAMSVIVSIYYDTDSKNINNNINSSSGGDDDTRDDNDDDDDRVISTAVDVVSETGSAKKDASKKEEEEEEEEDASSVAVDESYNNDYERRVAKQQSSIATAVATDEEREKSSFKRVSAVKRVLQDEKTTKDDDDDSIAAVDDPSLLSKKMKM